MALTQEQAIKIVESREVVSSEGKYKAKVTSVAPYIRDGQAITIVNFNLMTPYHANKASEAYASEDWDGVANGTSMSTSILEGQYTPSKGEFVDVEVSSYTTKAGDDTFVVSSISRREAQKAAKFSFAKVAVEEPEIA